MVIKTEQNENLPSTYFNSSLQQSNFFLLLKVNFSSHIISFEDRTLISRFADLLIYFHDLNQLHTCIASIIKMIYPIINWKAYLINHGIRNIAFQVYMQFLIVHKISLSINVNELRKKKYDAQI